MSGGLSRNSLRTGARPLRRARRSEAIGASPEMMQRLTDLENAVIGLAQAQIDSGATQGEVVDRLEKQLSRAGKELFKANALADAQQKNAEGMLEQLRDAAAHRERELTQMRERLTEARNEGRQDLVQRLFPALDGLEEALASGRRLQERTAALLQPEAKPSFWQRLNPAKRSAPASETSSAQAMIAWLEGLAFVQERLLESLAAVGVVPIPTEGQAFDPHRHLAVETVLAAAPITPGTIVREHRRGYIQGDTVLRYAEVIVARAAMERPS